MPSLFRFLVTLGVLAALAYGAMIALVTFVEPRQADMSVRIPADRLAPKTPAPLKLRAREKRRAR